jgi:leucine-rich repeat protein SHOC2
MLAKNFCNNIYLIQFIFVWLVGIDVFFPLKTHGHSDVTDRTVLVTVPSEGTSSTVQRAQPGASMDVRSMAPSKRLKMPTSSQMEHVQRTLRTASAQGNLSAPDADLDAEPEELMCPITRAMFRDPVMVVESGHTYERSDVLSHFERNGAKDPYTNCALSSTKVMTNWAVRQIVQAWLIKHPGVKPDGWDSRELLEPSKGDGTRTFDDEGDVGVLRTWRAMCPALRALWPEAARPEDWEGVTMENGRVVELDLDGLGLTGAVPAEIGQLTSLRELRLTGNQLTSVPAEIGQLTSLERLSLYDNQLTSLPAEIWQLTSLEELRLSYNKLTSLPPDIGQLTSLRVLSLNDNPLTNLPAEIGQLTSLEELYLMGNKLTTLPAAIRELRAAGCRVRTDANVTVDE